MSYTYSTFITAVSQEISISSGNADFAVMLPTFIQNAELRIFRDLDLLTTVFRDTAGSISANIRNFNLPNSYGQFIVVEGVNLMVSGARVNALTPCSREYIDAVFPSDAAPTTTSTPRYFARDTDQTLILGPSVGSGILVATVEVVGTVRPAPLSPSISSTFISTSLPDLFLFAVMVEATGWMKNYGAQAEDPKMGISWEARYQGALGPALSEETRKKFQSGSWSAKSRTMTQPERV